MNTQPIEKRAIDTHLLDIVSIFPTIQGEGPYTGQRAVFVRLAGCNLMCPGCDTDYTTGRKHFDATQVVTKVMEEIKPPCIVVITGENHSAKT